MRASQSSKRTGKTKETLTGYCENESKTAKRKRREGDFAEMK